jgi:hypothetical protein
VALPNTILEKIEIEVDEPQAVAKSLKSKELQFVAGVYSKNVNDILGLLALPYFFVSVGIDNALRTQFFLQAVAETKILLKSKEDKAKVQAYAERLAKQAKEDQNSPQNPSKETNRQLASLLENEKVSEAVRSLLFAGVSAGWAAFESAAKDTWVVALNSRPKLLAQPAFAKLTDDAATEGLNAKHVSVGLLARHGFDLRAKLGLLLSDKFDFTGVAGIRTAYTSAFGKSSSFDTMFNEQNLATLEATRHLIVHRAGFVDEDYKRRTKDIIPLGHQLHIDGARVCELVNSSITTCCKMIRQVDDWLDKNQ